MPQPNAESFFGFPTEERNTFRQWYAEFDAAKGCSDTLEALITFRDWYDEFDAAKWDQQFAADVKSGRLDFLIAEADKDLQEGRCSDR